MSFDYTGSFSGSFSGDITASNGVISSSAQVNYTQVRNKPTTISAFQKNSIVANNNFRENTYPTDSASFDTRINSLGTTTDALDARIDALSVGSGSADWATLTNIPSGLVSSSDQILPISTSSITNFDTEVSRSAAEAGFGSGDGNHTDISSLNTFTGSIQTEVDSLTSATSSYLTSEDTSSFISSDVTSSMTVATASYALYAVSASHEIVTELSSSHAVQADSASFISDTFISASAVRSGFGAGDSTDISALNTFTGSIQTEVNSLTSATSSYLTSADTGSFLTELPDGVISGSSQITITESQISDLVHTQIPDGTISSSAQITAVITDEYISASAAASGFGSGGDPAFGDPPTIDQDGLQVAEFVTSGSTIGTLTVTDVTPGDTATWEIQSSYTDGYFVISESGVVTANTLMTSSMNTSNASGSNLSHPFLVKVTDGQNNVVTGSVYIYVIPNSAPVFRQTSVGGSVITTITASANENSTDGTALATVYFTDSNSDAITIETGSVPSEFSLTINSNNVVITQNTASFDYETVTSYNMVITASDEHYQNGDDGDSVAYLPVLINITDNLTPTISNQTMTSVPEFATVGNPPSPSVDGTSAGNVSIVDTESDTSATIVSMVLKSAYLNADGINITSSLGGTSEFDPHANPFTYSGKEIIRKNGVYLNSTVADRYVYTIGVSDAFNTDVNYGEITIPITAYNGGNISTNGHNNVVYVNEAASSSMRLSINSTGLVDSDQPRWITDGPAMNWQVTSSGNLVEPTNAQATNLLLVLSSDVSGSAYSFDGISTSSLQITGSNSLYPPFVRTIDAELRIAKNNAPSMSFSNNTSNLNTNGARSGSLLTTISLSDTEGDPINHNSLTFTDPSGQLNAVQSGDTYLIQPMNNLSGSTYGFTASIEDIHGFRTTTELYSLGIDQAPVGGITSNGTLYIIESALSGSNVVISSSGFQGSQADLGVTYSTIYNGASVQSFTSSNAMLDVTNTGLLSLAQDISGSDTGSGDSFQSLITWRDQYDNIGSSTITIQVTENQGPFVSTYTPDSDNRNTNLATSGTRLAKMIWSDYEGDGLDTATFTLSGTNSADLSSSYSGSNTFEIFVGASALTAGTYDYTASIKDIHGFNTGERNDTITIAQADSGTLTKSGTFYIIESAETGDSITTNTSGIAGTVASVGVTYSPNYGSQVAQSFNLGAGHPYIDINSSTGDLVLGGDISGSVYQNGSNITTNVYWLDQYGNEGTGSITVNVTDNQDATATFTDESLTAPVLSGSLLVSATLSDPESGTPFSMSLSGDSATTMSLEPQNSNSSSYELRTLQDITNGVVLSYTASVFDDYNQETQYNRTLTISPPVTPDPLWYAYLVEIGAFADNEANALASYGDTNDDGAIDANYPFDNLADAEMGNNILVSSIYTGTGYGDKSFLIASGSTLEGSNSTQLLSNVNHSTGSNSNTGLFIVFPSSSVIGTLPDSMTNSLGGSTAGEYVLYGDRVGTGIVDAPQSVYVRYFDMNGSNTYPDSSATRFGVMFTQGDASTDVEYFFMASSGSAPSSTQ